MTNNTGKPFENLVGSVYEAIVARELGVTVERNVLLDSPDGPRQIDVLVRAEVAGHKLLTVVECRDLGKRLDVTHVDGLVSKMVDVRASKGVLVARKGFSRTAVRKAQRLGIDLVTVHRARDALADVAFASPVLVTELEPQFVQPRFVFQAPYAGTTIAWDEVTRLNGRPLSDIIWQAFLDGVIPLDPARSPFEWRPSFPPPGPFITSTNHGHIPVEEFRVTISWRARYWFGYLTNLDSTITLANHIEASSQVVFRPDELFDYRARLKPFDSLAEIPALSIPFRVTGVAMPVLFVKPTTLTLTEIDTGQSIAVQLPPAT